MPAFALLLLGPTADAGALRGAGRRPARSPTPASRSSGTLVGALAVQTRARDLIVPLLAPAAADPGGHRGGARRPRRSSLAGGAEALPGRWLAILGLYDLVFGLLAYAVFDFLVED